MLINTENPHPRQVGGVGVDEVPGGGDRDPVDQFPAHPKRLSSGFHTHPVDGEALEDPAGHPVSQFCSIVGTQQRGLEDLPTAGRVGACEARNPDDQAGGEPHDRQVDELTSDVVALDPGHRAVRAGVHHVHRVGVDDGEGAYVGGVGDRQAKFCGAADGVGDEVASRVRGRVLVR